MSTGNRETVPQDRDEDSPAHQQQQQSFDSIRITVNENLLAHDPSELARMLRQRGWDVDRELIASD
ncbi:hypothetical protein JW935_19175 [candidate division KSB1 bacterium]|nr:hypothetical protein [candidate division KSB1 bacterium]